MQPENLPIAADELLATMPGVVLRAAELVSVPHSVEDAAAHDLVRRFSSANGTTVAAVAEVKRLPFISPLEEGRWKVANPLRDILLQRLEERPLAREVDAYLAERLAADAREHAEKTPPARQLAWRAIYHKASIAPAQALDELSAFVDRAAADRHLSDLQAAVDLTRQRRKWLAEDRVEVAYIVGRTAYAFKDLTTAEQRFLVVWNSDTDAHRRIVAGHLLGVIWTKRHRQSWWTRAETILKEVAKLAREAGDRYGECVTLTSLGNVQSKLGDTKRLKEAEDALRMSISIASEINTPKAFALGALGSVIFLRSKSRAELLEAEDLLRQGLAQLPEEAKGALEDRLLRILGRLGDPKRLQEAEALLTKRLEENKGREATAITLHMLAQTQMRRGDPDSLASAEEAAMRSVELGRELDLPRHTAMSLLMGSFIAEKSGNIPLAIKRMEETISINEELGLVDHIAKGRGRLETLRRRAQSS